VFQDSSGCKANGEMYSAPVVGEAALSTRRADLGIGGDTSRHNEAPPTYSRATGRRRSSLRLRNGDQITGVGVMITKQLSIAIVVTLCIGSGITWKTFAAAPASPARIDFDQIFADATWQSQSPSIDRARKGDRLPSFKAVLSEPVLLPNCEPLASPFADPILGRIVGRCDA
jgi:hypothetical protein